MASKNGKVVCVSSVKGGVGKTILSINLAGIYHLLGKRVLLIDLDLYSGGIATCLDIKNKKDIFMLADSINNNRFTTLADYVTKYNENIDVLASPKDPRMANKVTGKYLPLIFEMAKREYDVVLVDTSHILDEINLTIIETHRLSKALNYFGYVLKDCCYCIKQKEDLLNLVLFLFICIQGFFCYAIFLNFLYM